MEITITNWDSYNPRKDIKSMSWLKLNADIGFSESLFGMPAEAKWLWVFILSFCAKKNSGDIFIELDYFSFHSGVKKEKIIEFLELFESRGLVSKKSDTSRVRTDTDESERIRTETYPREEEIRQDKTREEKKREDAFAILPCFQDSFSDEFLKTVKTKTQEGWLKTYPDPVWIKTEIIKAVTWLTNNPNKAPKKNLGQFFSNWFSRSWESYRKTIGSVPGFKRATVSEIAQVQIANNPFRAVANE